MTVIVSKGRLSSFTIYMCSSRINIPPTVGVERPTDRPTYTLSLRSSGERTVFSAGEIKLGRFPVLCCRREWVKLVWNPLKVQFHFSIRHLPSLLWIPSANRNFHGNNSGIETWMKEWHKEPIKDAEMECVWKPDSFVHWSPDFCLFHFIFIWARAVAGKQQSRHPVALKER